MNPSKIIDALGGTSKVARLCEVADAAVSQWRNDGIPNARLMFLKLARPDVFAEIALQDSSEEAESARNGGIRMSGDERDAKNIGE